MLLAEELNKQEADLVLFGGDTLDTANPSTQELELMFDFFALMNKTSWIYSGNHEMINKKTSVLSRLAAEISRCNPKCMVVGSLRSDAFDVISYEDLHSKWAEPQSKLCFTHVRAKLPEHMRTDPEIDLSKLDVYDKVISGDLHDKKMSQTTEAGTPIEYPGSPLSTSFHREIPEETNGYLMVDTETLESTWHDLGHLPHLIRKKVTSVTEMIEDPYNRVVYELEGDIESLGKVKGLDLLDKKINTKVSKEAKLNLTDLEIEEELDLYLRDVEGLDNAKTTRCITRFADTIKKGVE